MNAKIKMVHRQGRRPSKPIAKTTRRMRPNHNRVASMPPAGYIGMVRDAVLQGMKRLQWSTYQLWKASAVPRTIVYTFIGKDDGRDINLRHAEAMMIAVGVALVATEK